MWIDNLNGDKYRTGKIIPQGLPGGGSSDQSIFTTNQDPRGIQVGTCITTFSKRQRPPTTPTETSVHYREFWGRADAKRSALHDSADLESWEPTRQRSAAKQPEEPRDTRRSTRAKPIAGCSRPVTSAQASKRGLASTNCFRHRFKA